MVLALQSAVTGSHNIQVATEGGDPQAPSYPIFASKIISPCKFRAAAAVNHLSWPTTNIDLRQMNTEQAPKQYIDNDDTVKLMSAGQLIVTGLTSAETENWPMFSA
jgi:hypothetical protein